MRLQFHRNSGSYFIDLGKWVAPDGKVRAYRFRLGTHAETAERAALWLSKLWRIQPREWTDEGLDAALQLIRLSRRRAKGGGSKEAKVLHGYFRRATRRRLPGAPSRPKDSES
jgi:hypothetical protein